MLESPGTLIAGGALLFTILCAAVSLTWRISRLELSLRKEIRSSHDEVDIKHATAAREYEERNEQNIKMFGESSAALRQKIHEVELWMRDTFVRRDGYYKVQEAMENSIKALGDKIDIRLERMEAKIDSKT